MPIVSFQMLKMSPGHVQVVLPERIVHTLLTEMMTPASGLLHVACLKELPVKGEQRIREMVEFQPVPIPQQVCEWKDGMMVFQVLQILFLKPCLPMKQQPEDVPRARGQRLLARGV
jgi:hypothetical protein